MAVDTVEIRPIDIMSNQNGWNHLPNAQDKNNLNLNHNYVTLLQQQQQHIQLRMPPDNSLYAWDSDNHRIVNQHHQQQDSCSSSSGLDLTAESEKNDNHAEVLPSNNKSNVNVKQNQTDLIQESLRQLYQNLQEQQQNSSRWSPLSVNDITVFDTQTSGNNINNERSNLQNIHIPSGSFLTGSGVEPSTCNTTSDIEDGMRFELFEDTLGACPGAKTATQQQQQHQKLSFGVPVTLQVPSSQTAQLLQPDMSKPQDSNTVTLSHRQLQEKVLHNAYLAYEQQVEQNQSMGNTRLQGTASISRQQPLELLQQSQLSQRPQKGVSCQEQLSKIQVNGYQPTKIQDQTDSFSSQSTLPSTMVAPSVLLCTLPTKKRKHRKNCEKSFKRNRPDTSPQSVFEKLLRKAGHITLQRIRNGDAEYDAVPSALQLASFGTNLVKAVHSADCKLLSALLKCGLSPNPCNQFRDSIVDLVCKRASPTIFQCLVEYGADLQTVDGFGRTPLHHCCWASTFCRPIVDVILERDPIQLLIEDKLGQTPLEYVRANVALDWIEYLESNLSRYFPVGISPPNLLSPKRNRPDGTLRDPPDGIPVNLAGMVSCGKITPNEVFQMKERRKANAHWI